MRLRVYSNYRPTYLAKARNNLTTSSFNSLFSRLSDLKDGAPDMGVTGLRTKPGLAHNEASSVLCEPSTSMQLWIAD